MATPTANIQQQHAAAMVLAVLLHEDSVKRAGQLAAVEHDLPADWRTRLESCERALQAADAPDRLQIFRGQVEELVKLDPKAQTLLLDLVRRIIRADGQVSLTEHLYHRMLRDTLRPVSESRAPALDQLRAACTLLLSLAARAGQHEETQRLAAFDAGIAAAPLDGLGPLLGPEAFSIRQVDGALDALAATTPGFRAAVYQAVRVVALHDDHINRAEVELLATIGLALRLEQPEQTAPSETAATAEPVETEATSIKKPAETAALNLSAAGSGELVDETGWTQQDRVPARALIVANLIPLFGVMFFGWDVSFLLLLYWMENLVIGAFTLVRMFSNAGFRAVGTAAFFCIHYGAFCAVHGIFVLGLTSLGSDDEFEWFDFDEGDIPFLIPFYMLRGIFQWIALNMPELLTIPLLALIISHGISLVRYHFMAGEDRGRSVDEIMFDPYPRMAILHVSILFGAFFVINSGGASVAPVLILVILGKTWLDLHLHRRAHTRRRQARLARAED